MRILALLMTAAFLLTPQVSAEPALAVDSIDATGTLRQAGGLAGMSLIGDEGGLRALEASAATAVAYRYTTDGAFVAPGVCGPVTSDPLCHGTGSQTSSRPSQERYPAAGAYHDIDLAAVQSEARFNIHVFPLGGAALQARMPASAQYALEDACLDPVGIGSGAVGCDGFDADRRQLSAIPLGEHAVVTNATEGADVTIAGDVVLELRGVTVQVAQTGDLWRSGDDGDDAPAGTYERSILRIILTDAKLNVSYGPGLAESEWVARGGKTTAMGSTVVLHGARGFLDLGAGKQLDGGTETLTGDFRMATESKPGGIDLSVDDVSPASAAVAPPMATPAVLWAAALVLLTAAAGVAVARRRVSMRHVERALSKGQYGRAARLSQRLLRRDPVQESAHLSRAIAWARGGQPSRVVPAVQAYLEEHEPHDGALHYVLGLAYQELGDERAARDAMAAAAVRTPALLDEMAPDLRPRSDDRDGYT